MAADTCSICTVFLGSSKRIKVTEIAELLEILLEGLNLKLMEELLICDTCLIKVQSACKFKSSYLENSQKMCIKQEDLENEAICEVCKESVNPIDCIPMFSSATEFNKLTLFKFLSSELELKSHESPQTCELCHKSILNFCSVIKSFSVCNMKSKTGNSDQDVIVNSVDCTDDCRVGIKEEDAEVKVNQEPTTTYEDFLYKNEVLDLKTEEEPMWSQSCEEIGVVKCLSFNFRTDKKSLKNHTIAYKSSNEIEMFKCQICDFHTKRKSSLRNHMIVHKNCNEIEMFKCHICDYQTKYKSALKNHVIVHKNYNEIEMFKCHICDYQTKYKSALKTHEIVHKNCNEIDMFKCHICDYQTKYKSALKSHVIIHNEIEMFKCYVCDFQTNYKRNLMQHLNVHKNPNEVGMFKCHICGYQAKHKYTLKNHVIVHKNSNETEMFKCHICNYQTRHKGNLKSHVIVHNEIEMFKCHICDYQTKYKSSIRRHVIVHKNCNEIKMFKCQMCDYQTKYQCNLNSHMTVHKSQFCNFQMKIKNNFKKYFTVNE